MFIIQFCLMIFDLNETTLTALFPQCHRISEFQNVVLHINLTKRIIKINIFAGSGNEKPQVAAEDLFGDDVSVSSDDEELTADKPKKKAAIIDDDEDDDHEVQRYDDDADQDKSDSDGEKADKPKEGGEGTDKKVDKAKERLDGSDITFKCVVLKLTMW